jgi:hypothetical protein
MNYSNLNFGPALGPHRKETFKKIEETNTNIRSIPIVRALSAVTGAVTGKTIFGDDMEDDGGLSTLEIIGYTILGVGITGGIVYTVYKFKKL